MSGRSDHWKGNFLTQIRASPADRPDHHAEQVFHAGVAPDNRLTVSGRVVQGYEGRSSPTAGWLSSHPREEPYREVSMVTTDAAGLAHWTMRQSADTRYQVRFTQAAPIGASVSPSPPSA